MSLFDIPIQVSKHMAGSKFAVQFGHGPIIMSPAMYELVSKAETQDELRRLLKTIPLRRLPPMPSPFDPIPMFTKPPWC